MVSDSKGIFKCFGCGKWWDVITFAMEYERMDFVDTLKHLAEYAHIDLEKYPKFSSDPNIKQSKEQTKSLNQTTCNHFQANLQSNVSALEYLHKRNLDNQIISLFQLGYAPEWYYDLINYLKKYGFTTDQILEAGVCKAGPSGDIYDFFRNRIIFPIQDQVGNIIAFTGRIIDPKDNPKYLNITNTTLYDKSKALYGINFVKKHISTHNKIIVVEWNMDVIALHRLWLPIGVATCGTSLSQEHVKTLKRHTDHILFCFDNDEAGFSATVRWLKMAYEQDLFPQVIELENLDEKFSKAYGKIKDIDDLANAGGNGDDLLSASGDGLVFVINQLKKKYNLTNPVDKKKVIDTLFEIIKSINDLSITQHYIHEISNHIDINEQTLLSQYKSRYKKTRFWSKKEEEIGGKAQFNYILLLQSLIENENWKKYVQWDKIIQIITYYKELNAIIHGEKESTTELSNELWRDQEMHGMDEEKKNQFIGSLCLRQIDELLKSVIKTSALSGEQKADFLERRRKLSFS